MKLVEHKGANEHKLRWRCTCGREYTARAILSWANTPILKVKGIPEPTVAEPPKHWRPHLLEPEHVEVKGWAVGTWVDGKFEGDGGAYTYAEALKQAKWLNEQERQAE